MISRRFTLSARVRKRGGDDGYVAPCRLLVYPLATASGSVPPFVEARNESGIEMPGDEFFVAHDLTKERQRRLNATHCVFIQGAPHSIDGLCPRASPNRELRNHRIVVNRHLVPGNDAAVVANSGAAGRAQESNLARRRKKVILRVFGVDPTFDRGPAPTHVFLAKR